MKPTLSYKYKVRMCTKFKLILHAFPLLIKDYNQENGSKSQTPKKNKNKTTKNPPIQIPKVSLQ